MTMNSSAEDMYSQTEELEREIRVYSKLKEISKLNKADFDFKKISDYIRYALG